MEQPRLRESKARVNVTSVYRVADQVRMPWKNGAGTTLEVARDDDPATAQLLWRVSVADVASGDPFSAFDGYRRIISVLAGEGMLLTVDGERSRPLRAHDPFAFDGGAVTTCELLGGPIRDINLIFDQHRLDGRMRWVTVRGSERIDSAADTLLIYNAAAAPVQVELEPAPDALSEPERQTQSLAPGDCLRAGGAGGVHLRVRASALAACAVIELSMLEHSQVK